MIRQSAIADPQPLQPRTCEHPSFEQIPDCVILIAGISMATTAALRDLRSRPARRRRSRRTSPRERGGYTVDRVRTWAEAVAIRGDEIVYVGGNKGAARYVGPRTRVVNLAGKLVLPGFRTPTHPPWPASSECTAAYDLETSDAPCAVAQYAKKLPTGMDSRRRLGWLVCSRADDPG
jgi:hypothetical protein